MFSFTIRLFDATRKAKVSCSEDTTILQILQKAQSMWNLPHSDYMIVLQRTGEQLNPFITLNLAGIYKHDVLVVASIIPGGGMILQSLIIEQLEVDGTSKTFRMRSEPNSEIIVAFADEYEEPREGPLYFLDKEYTEIFTKGFAKCESRRLGKKFRYLNNQYEINISWRGITTKPNELSLYSLSLPKYAVPQSINIEDPQKLSREFRRNVIRDDQHNRFIIYLECRSKYGLFDFDLNCKFSIDSLNFSSAQYKDSLTENNYGYPDILNLALEHEEKVKVQEFLGKDGLPNNMKLSIYNIHNSQFAGGIVDANTVDAQQIGGNVHNNDA